MVNIRNTNEIISSLIDFYRLTKPELTTNPGSVTRDVFISPLASQLSLLYDQLGNISSKQSLRFLIGSDLDKFAKNFGLSRKQATASSGVAILTFKSVDGNISINKGDLVYSLNGVSFSVTASNRINSANSNYYRSIAIKYKADLDLIGITDLYALEVPVSCTTNGSFGNIAKYNLTSSNISGVTNVTNVSAFLSGSDSESDSIFKNRILATFSGSSVGTNLGYFNAAASVQNVVDVYVAEPNDPLMQRDGTLVEKNVDGTLTITKEGSGGKVDVIVLGTNLIEASDTFIYLDKSNKLDPTDSKNNYVLGQILSDSNKTVSKKRSDNIKNGTLPTQPVTSIVEVSGSLSGNNFKEKTVDVNGNISGNYEIIKDTGYYSGTPWGFDTFKWISDKISDFQEERIKNQQFGQDELTFTGIKQISKIEQNILITNENSKVTSDRSILQLLHYPVTSVTRVFNTNTGERYIISNQNIDGSGSVNTTGRIKITGNTLPSISDVLQVDYTWLVDYDSNIDFDGLANNNNIRNVEDSVDWSLSSSIKDELVTFYMDESQTFYSGKTISPINSVVYCKTFKQMFGTVFKISSGKYINRLGVTVNNIPFEITSVDSVKLRNSSVELYNTSLSDGLYTSTSSLYFSDIVYSVDLIMPSDTSAQEGDEVILNFNYVDVFSVDNLNGSSSNYDVTIPVVNVGSEVQSFNAFIGYISSSNIIQSNFITNLPASKQANGFINSSNTGFKNLNIFNNIKCENLIVQLNTDSELYVELSISNENTYIDGYSIVSVVNTVNGLEYWNLNNKGIIDLNQSNNKYQLIFSGYNTPTVGDRVCAFYYPKEIINIQNLIYQNNLNFYKIESINFESSNYFVKLNNFVDGYSLSYDLINTYDGYVYATGSDGYLISNLDGTATFGSSINYTIFSNIESLKIKIKDGLYQNTLDVIELITSNTLKVTHNISNLSKYNFFVYRLLDGKEIQIENIEDNKIILSGSHTILDKVLFGCYEFKPLKSSPSRFLSSISDNVTNPGSITIAGPSVQKATDVIFTKTTNSLVFDLSEAIRDLLSLNSTSSIPSNVKLVKVVKLEKVIESNNIVSSVENTLDVLNAHLKNGYYFNNFVVDDSLNNFEIKLSNTLANNVTSIGDKIRATFYIIIDNDNESISFTRNGNQYTNKKFLYINKITSSGFKSSKSTKLNMLTFNEPNSSSRYKVTYDYTAPKQNERISIRYNYNKLISDVTFALENSRPINADVLAKEASTIQVSISISILINTSLGLDENTIKQNVSDAVTNKVNQLELGRVLEDIDIQLASDAIDGVDRTRILYFNIYGNSGSVTKLVAQSNEVFNLKELVINLEYR